jgi:hypothetical protein
MSVDEVSEIYLAALADARMIRSTRRLKRMAEHADERARECRYDDPGLTRLLACRKAIRDELAQRGVELPSHTAIQH